MTSILTNMFLWHKALAIYVLILAVGIDTADCQECLNSCPCQCPPLNDIGVPIPSLCAGNDTPEIALSKSYDVCHPVNNPEVPSSFKLSDFKSPGRITVISNYYIGCNAGRRESGVFAHVAQRYWNNYKDRVTFISSLKGGATCRQWAGIYQRDAKSLYPQSGIIPEEMPLAVNDDNYELRDLFFTTPYGHPSYVILDENLTVRHKFIGPCCGYISFSSCTPSIAKTLENKLSEAIDALLLESSTTSEPTISPGQFVSQKPTIASNGSCVVEKWTKWSSCSVKCGDGIQFRWRIVRDNRSESEISENNLSPCPKGVDVRKCSSLNDCPLESCIPEFGENFTVKTIADGFNHPRDVAFHPSPGLHLGKYSEGRRFSPWKGEEAWVVNGYNHSASIVSSLGTDQQTTISRRDRGYYHYMINATALSFNSVSNSGRSADKDSFNYWAVCNDNTNTYLDTKESNFFMGPTLYNSSPEEGNTVNRLGEPCGDHEQCFFLHSDMLHEAPACIGIAHDPEIKTAFGNVYWAFDATGNQENGQLVRFDFQQPHGPGSMDHSVAAIRRYPEVVLTRGPSGVHAGMVVHPTKREVYIANPGEGTVIVVGADSGRFARTAREEYPIYSNRLPSFEYSIWECVDQRVFASGLAMPSGIALSADGKRLFVAEYESGNIHVYEISSGSVLKIIRTDFHSIGGMNISPKTNELYFVDANTNSLVTVHRETSCATRYTSRSSYRFTSALNDATLAFEELAGPGSFSLDRDYECVTDAVIPNSSFFEQVHTDSGYASNDTDVQGNAGMDEGAALLANRTDCGVTSDLNFDALLLGGYYCHTCLPNDNGAMCDSGGVCENVQWQGYVCDNEYVVDTDVSGSVLKLSFTNTTEISGKVVLKSHVTYRLSIKGNSRVSLHKKRWYSPIQLPGNECGCAKNGPLLIKPSDIQPLPRELFLRSSSGGKVRLEIEPPCFDYGEMKYKWIESKNCRWLSTLKNWKIRNICERRANNLFGRRALVKDWCRKTCGVCNI